MLEIRVICLGTLKESYLKEGIAEYTKRLTGKVRLRVIELKEERLPSEPSDAQIRAALDKEADAILKEASGSYRIALCVEGKQKTGSEDLARTIEKASLRAPAVSFIIGSSFGLSEKVKRECEERMSFSTLTFPHQLMRLILCESIYRSVSILSGTVYHK